MIEKGLFIRIRKRTLRKDTLALLYSIQEKMERNLEDVDKTLDWQSKFKVSENRKIVRSITDTIIFLGNQGLGTLKMYLKYQKQPRMS